MDGSLILGKEVLSQLMSQIESQYGLLVLMLVAIIGFGCFLFWSLIWKVWNRALSAKEEEITRLTIDRNTYRALVFEDFRISKTLAMKGDRSACGKRTDQGSP